MNNYCSVIDGVHPNDPNEPLVYPTYYGLNPNDTGSKRIPYDYVLSHLDDFVYYACKSDIYPSQKTSILIYLNKHFPEAIL